MGLAGFLVENPKLLHPADDNPCLAMPCAAQKFPRFEYLLFVFVPKPILNGKFQGLLYQ
jgi:hypothetical protein